MKKTIIALMALVGMAAGESLTLPNEVTNPTQNTELWQSISNVLDTKLASFDYGYHVGPQGGFIGNNWHTPKITIDGTVYYEGDWRNGIITLAGRSGTGGVCAGFVLGKDIAAGTVIKEFTFSASGYANNPLDGDITIGLGVRDANGKAIVGLNDVTGVFNSKTGALTLILETPDFVWEDGYKIVAGVKGLSGAATTAYVIDGISASYTIVPEPTTATLSLLALAGLAARRRRASR